MPDRNRLVTLRIRLSNYFFMQRTQGETGTVFYHQTQDRLIISLSNVHKVRRNHLLTSHIRLSNYIFMQRTQGETGTVFYHHTQDRLIISLSNVHKVRRKPSFNIAHPIVKLHLHATYTRRDGNRLLPSHTRSSNYIFIQRTQSETEPIFKHRTYDRLIAS